MLKLMIAKKKILVIVAELIVFLAYALFSVATYEQTELIFTSDDMQLQDMERNYIGGGYLDTSYEGMKAVVTPAFQLKKGIYYFDVSYAKHGIVQAGLIYNQVRNGKELVDNNEFPLNSKDDNVSFRVRIHDNSAIRFKIRLTGDAAEGDYIQLLQVHVVSSKLTYVYPIFFLAAFLLILDLFIWWYYKYYKIWGTERRIVLIALAFTAFFVGLPLYQNGLTYGVDLDFHLQRLEGVYKGLLTRQFPVRIQPGWLDGYGYASSIFYGDIFLYFPAILRMIGFTLQDAFKYYAETVNIVTVLISFYAFRKMCKDDIAAMVGSILYTCSAARLVLWYTAMIGNYSAMMFYPLVLEGFYLLLTEDEKSKEYKKLWIPLTLGFTGLLMTHMISCLMIGAFSILCCLVMIRKIFRKNTLLELVKAVAVSVLLNLWFLVPFLQYMIGERLHINTKLGQNVEIEDYYAYLENFAQDGKNLYQLFVEPYCIGFAILFVLLLYIITIPMHKKNVLTKCSRGVLGFTVFALWVCTDLFPVVGIAKISFVFPKFFTTIQYQDRFISVMVAFAASLGAFFFVVNSLDKRMLYMIAGLLCCVALYQDIRYFETIKTDEVYLDSVEIDSHNIGNAEYLPIVTNTGNLTKEIEKDEALQIHDIEHKYLTFDISVTNPTEQEQQILLPVLYYSGYKAYDSQGKAELETFQGDNGRVAVSVPADYNGTFHMAYYEPWYWRVSEIVSLVTLLFILYYTFKGKEHTIVWKLKRLQTLHSENTAG